MKINEEGRLYFQSTSLRLEFLGGNVGLNEYKFFPTLFIKLLKTEDNLSTSDLLTSITATSP